MKILCIGNSFSQDANIYFHRLAKASGCDLEVLNLIIGGCSFETHARHAKEGNRAYMVQYNGKDYYEEIWATLDEGFAYRDWDYITIQQVSGYSGKYETFHPYIDTLVEKIKSACPKAKLLIHQTWAYEHGSEHPAFPAYNCDPQYMTECLTEAYNKACESIGADGIIPSGNVIQTLRKTPTFDITRGGVSLHRDGFHLSYDYGRYAVAATWFTTFGLGDIMENSALPDGENLDMQKIDLIKKTVKELVRPII